MNYLLRLYTITYPRNYTKYSKIDKKLDNIALEISVPSKFEFTGNEQILRLNMPSSNE